MNLVPMEFLDELIRAGWGEVPREKIPENWRETKPQRYLSKETRLKMADTIRLTRKSKVGIAA